MFECWWVSTLHSAGASWFEVKLFDLVTNYLVRCNKTLTDSQHLFIDVTDKILIYPSWKWNTGISPEVKHWSLPRSETLISAEVKHWPIPRCETLTYPQMWNTDLSPEVKYRDLSLTLKSALVLLMFTRWQACAGDTVATPTWQRKLQILSCGHSFLQNTLIEWLFS